MMTKETMSFQSIIGQPLAVELVQRWLAQASTQPLLFHGPEGVGRRAAALELGKALNCATTKAPCDPSEAHAAWPATSL